MKKSKKRVFNLFLDDRVDVELDFMIFPSFINLMRYANSLTIHQLNLIFISL